MSTYTQWRAAVDRGEKPRRLTYVCGDQPVLVEEIVDHLRKSVAPAIVDYHSLTARGTPSQAIWDIVMQLSLTPDASRLVIVRDTEALHNWEPLRTFLAERATARTYLLFVSNTIELPATKAGPAWYIEVIRARGRAVRCSLPNDTDLRTWIARQAPVLTDQLVAHLLERTGGNLVTIAAACAKISLLHGQATTSTIDILTEPAPAESFVDHLLQTDKINALRAAEILTDGEALAAVALLDSRLDMMATLWSANRSGLTIREITYVPTFLVRRWLVHSKVYDPRRCAYDRRVLAVIDTALRSGARGGVIEALVALW